MNNWCICWFFMYPLNAELNPTYHLLALLGGATIVVVSRLRVNTERITKTSHSEALKIKILSKDLGRQRCLPRFLLRQSGLPRFLLRILIFKSLTVWRFHNSFGIKGLN